MLNKSRQKIGSTLEVLVEGFSEETGPPLAAQHEEQAPEIDVVYVNDGTANLGDFVTAKITAVAYDLVGRIVG